MEIHVVVELILEMGVVEMRTGFNCLEIISDGWLLFRYDEFSGSILAEYTIALVSALTYIY